MAKSHTYRCSWAALGPLGLGGKWYPMAQFKQVGADTHEALNLMQVWLAVPVAVYFQCLGISLCQAWIEIPPLPSPGWSEGLARLDMRSQLRKGTVWMPGTAITGHFCAQWLPFTRLQLAFLVTSSSSCRAGCILRIVFGSRSPKVGCLSWIWTKSNWVPNLRSARWTTVTSALCTWKPSPGGGNNAPASPGGVETSYTAPPRPSWVESSSVCVWPTSYACLAQPAPFWERAWGRGVSWGGGGLGLARGEPEDTKSTLGVQSDGLAGKVSFTA